ncbi:MAG: response regulator [Cytophagales bacterium]
MDNSTEKIIKRVIVIDDDPVSNFVTEKILHKFPEIETIQSYTNPHKAIEDLTTYIESNAISMLPDMIFVDLNMPVMDGWSFIEHFNKLDSEHVSKIKLTILTSSVDERDVQKAKNIANVDGYIAKPLSVAKVVELKSKSMLNRFFPM